MPKKSNALEAEAPEVTPEEQLELNVQEYARISKEMATLKTQKDLLNKKIKAAVGTQLLSQTREEYAQYAPQITRYVELVTNVSIGAYDEVELVGVKKELGSILAFLAQAGMTEELILEFVNGTPESILSRVKFQDEIGGYKVSTAIQDKSTINQEKAVEYLKAKGHEELLTTKTVVNEPALEMAIYNGQFDTASFKQYAIDENLVVALYVK